MPKKEQLPEDPDYWCDKSPKSGKNKGLFCGGNLRHPGKCGPWYQDEEREVPAVVETAGEKVEDVGAQVIPFHQPVGDEKEEPVEAGGAYDAADVVAAAEEVVQPSIQFRQPEDKVKFEEPDLRARGTYQHPVTGQVVPGVTSISGLIDKSGFLVPWSAKLAAEWAAANADLLASIDDNDTRVAAIKTHAERLRHADRDIGSLAHNTIEAIILGHDVQIDPRVQHQVNGFLAWREEYVAEIVVVEATVWSHLHGYAGTLDLGVVLKTGELALVDIKTGKEVHADAALQITALARAEALVSTAGETANLPWTRGGVLHLPKPMLTATGRPSTRGSWSYRPIEMREIEWQTFLALRAAWEWEHKWSSTAVGGKQTKLMPPAVK